MDMTCNKLSSCNLIKLLTHATHPNLDIIPFFLQRRGHLSSHSQLQRKRIKNRDFPKDDSDQQSILIIYPLAAVQKSRQKKYKKSKRNLETVWFFCQFNFIFFFKKKQIFCHSQSIMLSPNMQSIVISILSVISPAYMILTQLNPSILLFLSFFIKITI